MSEIGPQRTPISYEASQPYEVWPLNEPTVRAVNGDVEMAMQIVGEGLPHEGTRIRLVLYV
jgi:hypothetical protein